MNNYNNNLQLAAQSQGPGTGRERTQPLSTGQHSNSQANLHSQQNAGTQIVEEKLKHQNGEVTFR